MLLSSGFTCILGALIEVLMLNQQTLAYLLHLPCSEEEHITEKYGL